MAFIKELRWGIAFAVTAASLGCSSGSPDQGSGTCQDATQTACPKKDSGALECTNTKGDLNNCGSCGKVCSSSETCTNGSCVAKSGSVGGSSSQGGSSSSSSAKGGNSSSSSSSSTTSSQGGSSSSQSNSSSVGGSSSSNSSSTSKGGSSNTSAGGTSSSSSAPKGGATNAGGTSSGSSQGGSSNRGGASNVGGQSSVGGTSASVGGTSGAVGGSGAGGSSTPTSTGPCADTAATGMISDFEEGAATTPPVVKDRDGRKGEWERYAENVKEDGSGSPNFKIAVETSGAGAECNKSALHVTGATADWGGWVGVGINLTGTRTNPDIYDASKYTGVRFKAKKGTGHDPKSAVRFNISMPETEGTGSPGDHDACVAKAKEDPTKAARDCYQHMGRFLHVASGFDSEYELGSDWKTYNFCFDRDLYPLSLPSLPTEEQRNALSKRILKMQWQFNLGKDWYQTGYVKEYTALAKTLPFDFWVDDVEFFAGDCPNSSTFKSTDGAKKAFPQNTGVSSSCEPPDSAKNFAHAITRAYTAWTKNFVRDNKVIAPEQEGGVTTSESMGYGMLIAASMGDKPAFDKFWGYVQTQLSGGLMGWKGKDSGSATDGDVDIAYALLMADAQWGGDYKGAATSMISAIKTGDVSGDKLKPGNGWDTAFNPSYFAPSYFKAFGGMDSVISGGYTRIKTNTGSNFPTDWTDWSGGAIMPSGAAVTAGFKTPAYGYDAARVPWRVGLGGCAGDADGKAIAKTIVDFFAGKYDSGASIDLLKAGWMKSSGAPAVAADAADNTAARDFQGSFIGPIGVGAMAAGNAVVRDRAFRTILDILENPDFNRTYFPSTVGMITLLVMSGNFPTP